MRTTPKRCDSTTVRLVIYITTVQYQQKLHFDIITFHNHALRSANRCESVAALQQGLWALLRMIGFRQVLTVRAATRLFSKLLSGSDYMQQGPDN
jgi:hypothetical protein